MVFLKRAAVLLPLALGACATTLPSGITAPGAGFRLVADRTQAATGRRSVLLQSAAQAQQVGREVHALTHQRTISADTAVQVALLNNRGLQASYAEIGLSAAEVWQQATPENPVVALGVLGIGAPEVGAFRAIESLVAVNLLDAPTRRRRVAVAQAEFQRAQMQAVVDTLSLAYATRTAWIDAVAAFETVALLAQAAQAADASSELALELGRTGALNRAGQAREQVFDAELAAQTAEARLAAASAKENLTRLMGLYGTEVDYYVPDALPALPGGLRSTAGIEATALRSRVDLEVARLGLAATARAYGLTNATRRLTDLEVITGVELEREPVDDGDGEIEQGLTPQVELEFAIPIFDSGRARLRKAELSYLQAANVLAEAAVAVRSEARDAETQYRGSYAVARQYRDVVLPLRAIIDEQALLANNGMITSTFELLIDIRAGLSSQLDAAQAKQRFWSAAARLDAAIYGGGGGAGGGEAGAGVDLAGDAGGGH
ncbi:TolC family protein [uncultured Jannaschia sp.]|uniref:TolC family protein n=1 Tax=uncultured Jannaschia sp. TaxID=293347 RepID=UPI00261D3FB9|nr:TolC family protein [uncultured Jannaschia sp.]